MLIQTFCFLVSFALNSAYVLPKSSKQQHYMLMWPFGKSTDIESTSFGPAEHIDVAPTWEEIDLMLRSKEDSFEREEYEEESLGRGHANHRGEI